VKASIYKRNGKWQVKWRNPDGSQGARTFTFKKDAERYRDQEVIRARELEPALYAKARLAETGGMTLAEFLRTSPGWLSIEQGLAPATRAKYNDWALVHLKPLLEVPLAQIDVPRLFEERLRMQDAGASVNTRREVMTKLGRILDQAVLAGAMGSNPVRSLPADGRRDPTEVKPLWPVELEQLVADLYATGGANQRWGQRGHAIALLGGRLGLSPIEIRLIPWHQLRDGQLHIRAQDTKPSRAHPRSIDVDRETLRALKEWQIRSGGRGPDPIVGPMTAYALKRWGMGMLRRHVERITDGRVTDATTYTLRHSHASALHHVAGYNVPTAAERLGHTQQTHIKHYTHVLAAIRGERYDSLDALIEDAQARARDAQLGERLGSARST
jgi:integrase